MNVTFFYDIRFLVRKKKIYSHYGVTNSLFDRYLDIFDKFTYVGRRERIHSKNKVYIQDKYQVTNISLITFKNNYSNVYTVVKKAVSNSEFCICRLPSIAGLIACFECRRQGKPYAIEVVGNILEALWYHSNKGKIFALPIHLIMKYTVWNSKNVAYITEGYLQKCYPTKGFSRGGIANVSLPNLDESILNTRIQKIKDTQEQDVIHIGLIGSLDVNYKGHDTAIKAIVLLKDKFPYLKLHFLGQGSYKRWEEMANELGVGEQVIYDGSLPGGQPIYDWLDQIDIYIQPSITEGHGRAVVEAMSRGCVVFAAKTGGLVDSLDAKFLFSKRNYKQLANLIESAIYDKEYQISAATKNFEKVKKYESHRIEQMRKKFYWIATHNR
jgi:glycosyltransferase involved in cell wall biosynthesis